MPSRPPKPCPAPGCHALTTERYCDVHKPMESAPRRRYDARRNADPVLGRNAKLRNSAQWQAVRRQVRAEHPLCEDPFKDHERIGVTESSEQVHHIKPLSTHPELAFTRSNLMAVCELCHAKIERQERAKQREEAI
jgi:5-methylcytosine-specific restriction enzyme A